MGKRVTIKQASEFTGLSVHSIRMGIKQGKYPFISVGLGGKKLLELDLLEQALLNEALSNSNTHDVIVHPTLINCGGIRKVE